MNQKQSNRFRYLLKWGTTWNNLKRPTTSKKRPETTYNDLQQRRNDMKWTSAGKKRPETTWNDLQRARNNLKHPTTSKTQPIMTWTYLQQAKKRHETIGNKQIFRLFYNMGQRVLFSNTFSTQHLVAIIWALLSFKHLCSIMCIFYGI